MANLTHPMTQADTLRAAGYEPRDSTARGAVKALLGDGVIQQIDGKLTAQKPASVEPVTPQHPNGETGGIAPNHGGVMEGVVIYDLRFGDTRDNTPAETGL